jgi:protein-disulfide isomerase
MAAFEPFLPQLPFPYSETAQPGLPRSSKVKISRRKLLIGTAAFVAAGSLGYLDGVRGLLGSLVGEAAAQPTALMAPGPLGDMVMGSETAPVTIVEYASLTCPHCREFAVHTFPELKKRFIDTGKVRYIFREFALNDVDLLAIVSVRCASKEKFFPLIDTLYEKQDIWAVNNPVQPLLGILKQAGFTDESFKACASNQKIIEGVKAQRETGSKVGVNSTPTFFINGEKQVGAIGIDQLEKLIQPYLKEG